ncbi:radical SAM protein [Acetatifactor muris]|uniref:Cyclic pyranopterin monophosphate synthase n=1 Tax=Acetatifactor muris TaxID=879566 RepID=A0A2K4ZK08_9FIRM|nr:radical SAM protein [Acetatifactor muris]MCR2049039.1 radical SAM protein [Acetatifactor muris]SOY30818.1 Cyclic pyranopterin monophosphate synthase [Acetatifactor muris]
MNRINLNMGCTSFPTVINIELTDRCPLTCPYCYKDLEMVHNIEFSVLVRILHEFAQNGGKYVLLSGGEPLLYPHLMETLTFCKNNGLRTAVSTSGYALDEYNLNNLFKSGLNSLFISLNSHIQEINSLSRDGYEFAINAMELCNKLHIKYRINTVVRHDSVKHLLGLVEFARKYGAIGIDLLSNKPNNEGIITSPLDNNDLRELIRIMNDNSDFLNYQTCFTQVKAYFNKISGHKRLNLILKGCSAGRYSMAIFSDGLYAPCPHSREREEFDSIYSYWNKSTVLAKYRKQSILEDKICFSCSYKDFCSPCLVFPVYNNCLSDFDESGDENEGIQI